MRKLAWCLGPAAAIPLLLGARGGCGPVTSTEPAPDVNGSWAVTYDDTLGVEIRLGGAVYQAEMPAEGGSVTITHDGTTFELDLDCGRTEIVCPSEAWPESVVVEQREAEYPHRMWVRIPQQTCSGTMRAPTENECGEGTLNPDCEEICEGEIITTEADTFGLINEEGTRFDLLLGAGVATNGINCALLGVSSAHADLVSTGSAATEDWTAQEMANGEVVAAYGGGCLWYDDGSASEDARALVLGASVTFTTGFTAVRAP
jgi:hypothetical protein